METRFQSVEERLDRAERQVRVLRGVLRGSVVGALALLATAPGIGGATLKPITELVAGTGLTGGGTGPSVTLGVAPGGVGLTHPDGEGPVLPAACPASRSAIACPWPSTCLTMES